MAEKVRNLSYGFFNAPDAVVSDTTPEAVVSTHWSAPVSLFSKSCTSRVSDGRTAPINSINIPTRISMRYLLSSWVLSSGSITSWLMPSNSDMAVM